MVDLILFDRRQGVQHPGNGEHQLPRPLVGGGGGGRPGMAQAGGKNPAGIPEALAEAAKVLESQLS